MSEPTLEELQEQLKTANTALEEAKKGGLSKEDRDRLTYLEGDNKKLIEARDTAKEAKRLADEKLLAEQGEFKTLAEQRQTEVDRLTKDLEGRDETLSGYKARDEKELEALLPKVPEHLREEVSDLTLPLATRLSLARKLSNSKGLPPEHRGSGEGDDKSISRQAYDAMSPVAKQKHLSDGGQVHD